MRKRTINITESQLRGLVGEILNENYKDLSILYNQDGPNDFSIIHKKRGPLSAMILYDWGNLKGADFSPLKRYDTKVAGTLARNVEWEFSPGEDIMVGYMSAEVNGTADNGDVAVARFYATVYANPRTKSVGGATVEMEDGVVYGNDGGRNPKKGASVYVDVDYIAELINDMLATSVRKGY